MPSLSLGDISLELNNTIVNPLNASQIIHYLIPQTQIGLVIHTGALINSLAMRTTVESCLMTAHAVMDKHGNVYMFPDPLLFKMPSKIYTGLQISAHSTMVPGLKWTDLIDTLSGFEQIMLRRAVYKEAHVKMYNQLSGLQMGELDLFRSSAVELADPADLY